MKDKNEFSTPQNTTPQNSTKKSTSFKCEESPLLLPAAEILRNIFNYGWLSRSQVLSAYGRLGERALVFMRQNKVITEQVRKTDKGFEYCYSLADKRFNRRSPEDLISAVNDSLRKAGI